MTTLSPVGSTSLNVAGRNVPRPETRIPLSLWRELRQWMIQNDADAAPMLKWAADEVSPPPHPEKMASEIVWIILCAGKTAQAARTIEKKVWDAIDQGRPVVAAFGHKARAAAIETVWRDRERLFAELATKIGDEMALLEWCRGLPWVGEITAFQLMKNFGVDCPKPDIWLCRLAGIPDRPGGHVETRFAACRELCLPLAAATGDRIAVVDSLLWLACNKGVLSVSPDGGPIDFRATPITARPIIVQAETPQLEIWP